MNYIGEISIGEALAEIQTPGTEFSLHFIKSTGKGKGELRYYPKCRYGAPLKASKAATSIPRRRKKDPEEKTMRNAGQIPMTNIETGLYVTPLISHIIGFNNRKVIH